MNTTKIFITVTPEPPGFHRLGTDETCISVHLAFDGEETAIEELLKRSQWDFVVYRVEKDGANLVAKKVEPITVEQQFQSPREIEANDVLGWLREREGFKALPVGADPEVVAPEQAVAFQLLLGSVSWNAPVPHAARLMRILQLKQTNAPPLDNLIVLPVDSPSISGVTKAADKVTVPLVGGELNKIEVITNVFPWRLDDTLLPKTFDEAIAPGAFPVPVNPEGFLFRVRSEEDFRLLQTFEPAAANLYWSLPALLDVSSELLQTVTPAKLADVGCAAALDPLWIALHSPGAKDREGALLAPLMRLYDKKPTAKEPLAWLRGQLKKITIDKLPDILGKRLFPLPEGTPTTSLVVQKLREFLATLQQERGLEDVLQRILQHVIKETAGEDELHALLADYQKVLTSEFNALEAVRHDCGHLLTRWLTDVSQKPPVTSLADVIKQSLPYSQRLDRNSSGTLNEWSKAFLGSVIALDKQFDDKHGLLKEAWNRAVQQTLGIVQGKPTARFSPDRIPQPIPLAIAANASGDDLDRFTELFNGAAVLVRRGAAGAWAHANLAAMRPLEMRTEEPLQPEYPPEEWEAGKFAVKPFLPVAVDGRREMFLQYQGLPLASPAFSATGGPEMPPVEPDKYRRSFHIHRDAIFKDAKYTQPPRVAYAASYEALTVAVSKGGTLPAKLQVDKVPWIPRPDIDLTGIELKEFINAVTYQRRTAIGSTTFGALPPAPQRIGAQYENVCPLALDFPRASLSTANAGVDMLDLFRRPDGVGQLDTPTQETNTLCSLRSQLFVPEKDFKHTTITVQVQGDPSIGPDAAPLKEIQLTGAQLAAFLKSDLNIEIISDQGTPSQPSPDLLQLKLDAAAPGPTVWLRLKLTSKAKSTTWSFLEPEAINRPSPSGGNSSKAPILLISEKSRDWDEWFSRDAVFNCVLSRTTWLDWERWTNNAQLAVHGKPHQLAPIKRAAAAFIDASVLRGEDYRGDVSRLLDRLPDPSVCGFLIDLAQVDVIQTPDTSEWSTEPIILPAPDWLKISPPKDPPDTASPEKFVEYFRALREYLIEIDRQFQFMFRVACGAHNLEKTGDNVVAVSVPSGSVAKLTVRPLVMKSLFNAADAPFVKDMAQLAIGSHQHTDGDDCYVFPGAELLVEAMLNVSWLDTNEKPRNEEYEAILEDYFAVQSDQNSRTYRLLETAPLPAKESPLSRCFANVEIRTQRWRFSGRPIYRWINPKDFKQSAANAVIELDRAKNPQAIDDFESQLYFDRDDADCELARVRLLGNGNELAQFSWELPSATYFRHAFSLVSRYAGAMNLGERTWPRHLPHWSRRCAILADASRVDITRPQVRCLIPLSHEPTSASGDGSNVEVVEPTYPGGLTPLAPSPPLTCVLEERPFAVGGLADRIVSELATGVGFGFEPLEVSVQPIDSGKEASRDPRIDSRSWKHDRLPGSDPAHPVDPSHLFVLESEGPVGLHFDAPSVPAPAWSNCQYLLQPKTIDGRRIPDESFVGVRMRRILDPAWVVDSAGPEPAPAKLPIDQSWQATTAMPLLTPGTASRDLLVVESGTLPPIPVLSCTVDKSGVTALHFNRTIIAPNYKKGMIVLGALPLDSLAELRLLHTSFADGRYTLSVLATRKPGDSPILDGHSNFPTLLASIDWRSDSTPELNGPQVRLTFGEGFQVSQLTASSNTLREWGRTAKNFDWIHGFLDSECKTLAARNLRANKNSAGQRTSLSFVNESGKEVWPVSSLADSRQPLYLQRHLVAVFTKRSGGAGRQFDLFCGACMLNGRGANVDTSVDPGAGKVELHEVETPASIVAAGVNIAEFEAAYLDLVATGGVTTREVERSYRLHVRFANSSSSMAKSADLKILLSVPNEEDPTKPKKLCEIVCPAKLRAADIFLSAKKVHKRFHLSDGKVDREPSEAPPDDLDNLVGAEAIMVTLEAPAALGEVWADVSILHHGATGDDEKHPERFDFDWLFSTETAETHTATRVTPAALTALTEAQARFISASPPIEVSASKS